MIRPGRRRTARPEPAGSPAQTGMLTTHADRPPLEPLFTKAFIVLWFVGFFQEVSFAVMVHLPGYLQDLGATEARIGLVYSTGAVVALALRPAMGRIIDQWGRRRVMLAGGLLLSASSAAYIPLTTFGPAVFVVRAVHASVEITLFTTLLAFTADIVPASRRAQGLAIFGISGLLPIGLGSVLGDVVLGTGGFDQVFAIAAALALVSWTLAWWLPAIAAVDPRRERHRGFAGVVRQRDLGPVWLITLAFALAMTIPFTYFRTFVDATGIGSVGLYFGVYATAAIVVRLVASRSVDRAGARRVVVPSVAAIVIQFFVLAAASGPAAIVVAGVLGGVGHGLIFPVLSAMLANRASPEERGTAFAVFSGLFDVVTLVGAPVVGILIETAGYSTSFVSVAVVVAACAAVFVMWDRSAQLSVGT